MRHWELARYSIENSRRSPLRTTLTIIGIAIASGALVSMVAFVLGLRKQVEEPINKLGLLNNIEVRPGHSPKGELLVLDDSALKSIEAIHGVQYAYPDLRLSEITVTYGNESLQAHGIGIPREATLVGFSQELLVAGSFFSLGDEPQVVLSKDLVERFGLHSPQSAIGKQVALAASGLVATSEDRFEMQAEKISVTVVGVFEPPGFATSIGAGSLLLPVDMMRTLPASWMEGAMNQLRAKDGKFVKGFPSITVRAESPSDVIRVQKALKKIGYSTLSVMDRMKDLRRFFVFMEILLTAVGTVALVVAGLGILNTLMMSVMERYQEIGIYKAIGASDNDIRWLFLIEAAVVGLCGGIAGLGLAYVVSWILGWVFNTYAASQDVDGPMAVFVFRWWLLVGSVIYSIVTSVVSGLYPASRAARVDPIVALRKN